MFRELCGPEAYKNVVVLTTFWDEVPTYESVKREAELESKFFAKLVEGGAKFMRHDCTVESARTVLQHMLLLPPTFIQIQTEMGIDGLSLIETAVGSGRSKEIEKDLANYKKEIADLTEGMANLTAGIARKSNKTARKILESALRNSLAEREREYAELKKGLNEKKGGN